jgi:hypothetical protein
VTEIVRREDAQDVVEQGGALNLFGTTDPSVTIERATKVADALKDLLRKQGLIQMISGREYIKVEGWTALGSMLGVSPKVAWTRQVEDGWEARVEVVKGDGTVIAAAESQCTRSERTWKTRDDFALRSMAQTRAMGKALRMPLGFIAVLAGYEATPAEEMPGAPTPVTNIAELLDALDANSDSELWQAETVLANASRRFGRRISTFDQLTEAEAQSILAGAKKWRTDHPAEVLTEAEFEDLQRELE